MADKVVHPGVKSLLARFENSQQNTTSPPPRDRSPAGSDSLSKVRASFIAVEGGSQQSPLLGLRRISPQSEGPPTPSRVKSFSSDDFDGSVKSNGSFTQPTNGLASPHKVTVPVKKEIALENPESKGKERVKDTTANKENEPTSRNNTAAPALLTVKPTKTVSKKPSNVQIGKTGTTNKPASQPPTSKAAQSRTSTITSKHDNEKTTRPTKPARPSTIASGKNDSVKVPVHKSSRASLAPTNKPTARSRATTPAREITRSAPRASDVRSSSTARPARLPTSSTTPSLSTAGKLSAPGGATSTLSRKPSSLKTATTGARQRAITPTTNVRKQTSRTPPAQSGSERSHSRASTTTKPVDESFLARMMRPTASSANKAHEKVEVRSPPRSKPAHAPRRVPSRLENRQVRPTKEKTTSEVSSEHEERSLSVSPEAQPAKQQQEPKRDVTQQSALDSVEPLDQIPEPVSEVEEPAEEADTPLESIAGPVVEPADEPADEPSNEGPEITLSVPPEEPIIESAAESTTSVQPDEPVDPTTASSESVAEPTTEIPKQDSTPIEPSVDESVKAETFETTAPVELSEPETTPVSHDTEPEITSDGPLDTEQKPSEVDLDLSKLTLEDKDTA